MAGKKSQKRSGSVIYSYLKNSALIAVKREAKGCANVCTKCVKGIPFLNGKYTKRGTFSVKNVI